MKSKKTLLLFILLIGCKSLIAQVDTSNFDNLICKEWLLKFYEEDGDKYPPSTEHKNDVMIFFKDKTVKSVEVDKKQSGIWKFDGVMKILTIVDNDTKEVIKLNVIKLTPTELVIDYKVPDGWVLRMYMKPKG
jgi:hypothetical protein